MGLSSAVLAVLVVLVWNQLSLLMQIVSYRQRKTKDCCFLSTCVKQEIFFILKCKMCRKLQLGLCFITGASSTASAFQRSKETIENRRSFLLFGPRWFQRSHTFEDVTTGAASGSLC